MIEMSQPRNVQVRQWVYGFSGVEKPDFLIFDLDSVCYCDFSEFFPPLKTLQKRRAATIESYRRFHVGDDEDNSSFPGS